MIKERQQSINTLFGVIDVILSILAFFLAFALNRLFFKNSAFSNEYFILILLMIPTWYYMLKSTNLTALLRTKRYSTIFLEYVKVVVFGFAFMLLFMFVFNLESISRGVVLLFVPINLNVLFIFRITTFRIFKYYRSKGYNLKYIVVIADDSSVNFIDKVLGTKEWGYRIVKVLSNSTLIRERYGDKLDIMNEDSSHIHWLDRDIVDEVIYCKNEINQNKLKKLIAFCEEIGVLFRMQSTLLDNAGSKTHLEFYENTPFITFTFTPSDQIGMTLKWIFSIIASSLILLLWSPVILLIAAGIKLDSNGPVIFKQKRVGLRGRTFYMYKFRTMVTNAEELMEQIKEQNEADGPVFKMKDDPRITRLGKILRRTGLDELPQFVNIIKGDMSLIGPRPPIPEEVKNYKRWQLRRLSMKPGLTCTWQITPNRNDVSFEDWMKMDLQYIDSWSFKRDISLFLRTIRTVFSGNGQ